MRFEEPPVRQSTPPERATPSFSTSSEPEAKSGKPAIMLGVGAIVGILIGFGAGRMTAPSPEAPTASVEDTGPAFTPPADPDAAETPTDEAGTIVSDTTDADSLIATADSALLDSTPVATGDSVVAPAPAAIDSVAQDSVPAAPDIAPAAPADIDTAPSVSPDSAQGLDSLQLANGQRGPMAIDGLEVTDVSEIQFRGQAGFRVVQLLGSGDEVTTDAFPIVNDSTATGTVGRVGVVDGDSVRIAILRTETHMVYTSAPLEEDSLRTIVQLLSEIARP